ncbi:hypothetical protein [Streptomyces sp. AK08-02]|uniref:hypothetical protein n=1 Tax=Streptomyces sp. AK08-02 TaxID=3028654 RepID=UPI0029AEBBBD|nr:hypothetical protein [Streptomyces sp. AK08-02]MDX3752579.1 hypothetical protein [Streptomyces sp. AK08-02]
MTAIHTHRARPDLKVGEDDPLGREEAHDAVYWHSFIDARERAIQEAGEIVRAAHREVAGG